MLLCKTPDAADRFLTLAIALKDASANAKENPLRGSWRSLDLEERVVHALIKGIDDYIEGDVLELRPRYTRSLELVEGPLMRGMREVSRLFG